jgi:hypothetical protein
LQIFPFSNDVQRLAGQLRPWSVGYQKCRTPIQPNYPGEAQWPSQFDYSFGIGQESVKLPGLRSYKCKQTDQHKEYEEYAEPRGDEKTSPVFFVFLVFIGVLLNVTIVPKPIDGAFQCALHRPGAESEFALRFIH